MNGIDLIAYERQRQIEQEGWDDKHDDAHKASALAQAAICYAAQGATQIQLGTHETCDTMNWPWDYAWWKPTHDPIRNLVIAGALIAAQIDKELRRKQQGGVNKGGMK